MHAYLRTYMHTYNTLHYITLHYITLHYITLHYITLHYITLHYITLHYITLHHITLHCIALHCIALHYITLHCITLHYITLHYITLHYITLHYITLHYITLHYITYTPTFISYRQTNRDRETKRQTYINTNTCCPRSESRFRHEPYAFSRLRKGESRACNSEIRDGTLWNDMVPGCTSALLLVTLFAILLCKEVLPIVTLRCACSYFSRNCHYMFCHCAA